RAGWAERRVGGWSLPGSGGLEMRFGRLLSASALERAVRRSGRRMPPAENFAPSSGPRRQWPASGSRSGADHTKKVHSAGPTPHKGDVGHAPSVEQSGGGAVDIARWAATTQDREYWEAALPMQHRLSRERRPRTQNQSLTQDRRFQQSGSLTQG